VARRTPSAPANARGDKTVATNRRARHDYHILQTWEAGLVLVGSEVKSLREAKVQIREAWARVDDGEVWLHGMHISPYPFSRDNPDPDRRRKLLLHRAEMAEIQQQVEQAGLTLVPLRVYFTNGLAKVELALARGKHNYDKRASLAERDARRDVERAIRQRSRE
jgi:SsrA-binding protein